MIGSILQNFLVSGLSAYPNYKDTNIEWIGKIPFHWQLKKLKYISKVDISNVDKNKQENELPVRLCNYVDVYYHDYITEDLDLMEATASPEELIKWALKKGHVIVTKDSESWDDIAVPAYVPFDLAGVICGYHLALIEPDRSQMDGKYLFYSFKSSAINHQYQISSNGITRYGLGKYWIDNSMIAIPPISEQRSIAGFLSQSTAKIDALIAKKQRLIGLLEEQRTALISQAVTKGLNPSATLKDSGIKWLGKIPKHWDKTRIGFVSTSIQTGPFGSQIHSDDYISDGIPLINPSHLKNGQIIPSIDCSVDNETWQKLSRHELRFGDIVLARRGEMGRCGLVTDVEAGWLCGTGSIRLRPDSNMIDSTYLFWVISTKGIKEWLLLESIGSTMDNLNSKIIARIPIPLPPLEEQLSIAKYINELTARISRLIEMINSESGILLEYKSSLISASVTGKIDVRNFVK